ncbi:helix-turn-helix domain-containing protein [Streptomyces sp. NPDC058171]
MSAPNDSAGTAGLAPGENLAALRKERGLTQARLARKASVSLSLLSKIEVGDRALTPAVAAALGKPMGLTLDEVLGRANATEAAERSLVDLRAALRDYDLIGADPVSEGVLGVELEAARAYRRRFDVARLLAVLPQLLRKATTSAHSAHTAEAWTVLAEVYSTVYWVAARHRWMDLAELAVARQTWAVQQHVTPLGVAVAARDRAGTYLNFGDVERGLGIVDRGIAEAQEGLSGTDRDIAVCILNLRGMTLAGRLADKREARTEAERHIRSARASSEGLGDRDRQVMGLSVGVPNTLAHELATHVDLGKPDEALRLAERVDVALAGMAPTRIAATRIQLARAQLDVGNREGALKELGIAWRAAPQMARIHPMGREVFRVVSSLHRRSNPELLRMAKLAGIPL